MKRDDLIFELIEKEHQRQLKGIELIASENFVSDQVMQAMGSCLTNKYAEGYPGKRYYGGCEVVDQSEQIAIDRLKQIFGAEWANVQPHSGAQANAAVFLAVLNPGDKFMGLNLAHGGHLSHGSLVNTSGIIYTPCEYNLNQETGRVDYDQMEEVALREKPKMIIGGGSAYSREWDYKRMREIADKIGAILMIDMAHPAGLIAAGELDNPVKYAHIVTSTTHKTLRGPRGGVIMMGKDFPNPWGKKTPKGEIKMMSQLLDSAVFPGIQGGPLEHVIAAKAVAFGEILQPEWKEYAKQVKKNAAVLAQALIDRGFTIVSGGTDNHSMLVDLRSKYPDLTGKVAEKALVSADITVNKNMVPFDSRSAFQTSGIRLGTPAITTRGAKEDLMLEIAEMIETVLSNVENEAVIAEVRARVNKTMEKYPLFQAVLRKGLFWFYLESREIKALVKPERKPPCSQLYIPDQKSLLFRVSYHKNRINFEVYHALTDGTGAMNFITELVQDYLILAHPQADLPQIKHAEEITHGDKEEISTGKSAPVEFPSLFY